MPSKPDFAFPKTVSQNSEKELKSALKASDGPATVRALLNYGLAQTAINPDKLNSTMDYFESVASKVKDPATQAMIQLARANALGSDSLAAATVTRFDAALKAAPTHQWQSVVNADVRFFPSLYDFAVAGFASANDSIVKAAMAYDADRIYPLIYLEMCRADGDFDAYRTLFNRYSGTDAAMYPLIGMARSAWDLDRRREVYSLLVANRALGKEVESAIAYVTRPQISLENNSIVAKGAPLRVKVSATCLNSARLLVSMVKPSARTVATINLSFAGSGVFEADTVIEIPFDSYGQYRLTPSFTGMTDRHHRNYSTVTVTDFLLSRPVFGKNQFKTMALDVVNGAEQPDVTFSTTDRHIRGVRGQDRFSPEIYASTGYEASERVNLSANILTDRAIYHPGDTLRFAATLMQTSAGKRSLASGKSADVVLRNANYQPIDTLTLVSDDFGRISGAFPLPAEGLTGRFMLNVANCGSTSVMVSDYKAPTFAVDLTSQRLAPDTVELSGTAVGYNGFPLADARVALTVNRLPDWVWFRTFRAFRGADIVATDTVTTDASGTFTARIAIPAGVNLSATATATSPAGESHDAQAFVPFFRYHIEGEVGQYVEAGHAPRFRAVDARGEQADVPVTVTLTSDSPDSLKLTPDATWANIPSGTYNVEISAPDAARSNFHTLVYRRTDAMPPAESALFVPVTSAKPGDKLLAGTSFADSHIMLTTWTADSIIDRRWLTPERGNFFIDIDLPAGVNDATMTLHTLRNYSFHTTNVRISRPDVARSLKVEISSMRNHVTPGDSEKWTVRVTDNLGSPVRAAVMLDVYSKALDALQPFNWAFNAPRIWGRTLSFTDAPSYGSGAYAANNPDLPWPLSGVGASFNLLGQNWPREEIFNTVMTTSRKLAAPIYAAGAADTVVEECAVEEDSADSGATSADLAEMKIRGNGANGEAGAGNDDSDAYRLPEVAVAMWQPVLTSAPDGSLLIEFTAPDANTTWAVKALAYDRALLSGLASAEIVSSKPVMVQPQLPCFMRVGDRIELRAMVMNNTDSASIVHSFIELFDPATDRLIERADFNDRIGAKASKVIAMEVTAPEASMIGVRVRATAANFTDGEQSLVAILPNRVTVSTGRPLFADADSASLTVDVARGGVMTFTANAAWECVTALPGLLASESRTALSAVSALFSAATARGLMRSHPEIGRALCSWEQEDSVLLSRLMRNDDLKIALLGSTPFVNAAQTQSDRRARLALLFSNREIDRTVSDAVSTLTKLTRKGGLAWTQNSAEPSEWITLRVMQTLGQLKRMGYLPKSAALQRVIEQSLQYLDAEVAREYARNKQATCAPYVMMRAQFPEVRQSAPARRAAAATVQHLVGHWRDLPLGNLADAAIILHENNYPTTARKLLESLRQHEAWLQLPLSPALLNAFAIIEPQCAEVDMIRANYIARKQSTDWGNGLEVSDLVAAILNSGTTWLIPAANELSVKVNGHEVSPRAENFMGEFRLDLPQGGHVEISKGRYPAWGGVFSRSTDSITSVQAFGSEQVEITRTLSGRMDVGEKITLTLTINATQDLDYVIVTQPRCAGFEPVDQLPAPLWFGRAAAYREPCATQTNWFFNRLPKGRTVISETFYVTAPGTFTVAPAEIQSQYAPEFQAHTSGSPLTTNP